MKIKAIDIAEELGISKATVSLALNNKPGVSETTRQQVLECRKKLESRQAAAAASDSDLAGSVIKLVVFNCHNQMGDVINLRILSENTIDRIAKEWGAIAEVLYYDPSVDDPTTLLNYCASSRVRGIVVGGYEVEKNSRFIEEQLLALGKPTVIYDCNLSDNISCVIYNNSGAVHMCTERLAAAGHPDIIYFSRSITIYNYASRRIAFRDIVRDPESGITGRIVPLGTLVEEIEQNAIAYFTKHGVPDAMLLESYHVTIGVVKALRTLNISVPEETSFIGIDEVPDYMVGGLNFTHVTVPHVEKAVRAMDVLKYEITRSMDTKVKVYLNCKLVEGDTVKQC